MKTKFVKYSWGYNEDGSEKYAIVQPLDEDDPQVKEIREDILGGLEDPTILNNKLWAKMVYGSSVKYDKVGRILMFSNIKEITELDTKEVLREHFVGLL